MSNDLTGQWRRYIDSVGPWPKLADYHGKGCRKRSTPFFYIEAVCRYPHGGQEGDYFIRFAHCACRRAMRAADRRSRPVTAHEMLAFPQLRSPVCLKT